MWDKEKAIKHLNSKAETKSRGLCAAYTRRAIEAGGLVLSRHTSAKDYGISLQSVGFLSLGCDTGIYLIGDVVIVDGFKDHPHGHMAMFNGNIWVSDFKQRTLYPGPAHRKHKPNYTIFRYSFIYDSPISQRSSMLA